MHSRRFTIFSAPHEGSISISINYANDAPRRPDWPSARAFPVLHWVPSSWPRPQATSRFARHFPPSSEARTSPFSCHGVIQRCQAIKFTFDGDEVSSLRSLPLGFTPAGTPTTDMNIFRLTGDLSHLAAIIILLLKIWKTRSCAGEWP